MLTELKRGYPTVGLGIVPAACAGKDVLAIARESYGIDAVGICTSDLWTKVSVTEDQGVPRGLDNSPSGMILARCSCVRLVSTTSKTSRYWAAKGVSVSMPFPHIDQETYSAHLSGAMISCAPLRTLSRPTT